MDIFLLCWLIAQSVVTYIVWARGESTHQELRRLKDRLDAGPVGRLLR